MHFGFFKAASLLSSIVRKNERKKQHLVINFKHKSTLDCKMHQSPEIVEEESQKKTNEKRKLYKVKEL